MLRPIAGVPVLFGAALVMTVLVGLVQSWMVQVDNILLMVALVLVLIMVMLGGMTFVGLRAPSWILRVELWEARLLARVLEGSPRLRAVVHAVLLVLAMAGGWVRAVYLAKLLAGFGLGDRARADGHGVFGSGLALSWRCRRHPLIGRIGAWRIPREGLTPHPAPA